MPFVYMLECSDGSLYVGSTWSLEHRMYQHQTGQGAIYTARRLPVRLIWSEEYESVAAAFNREKQIQRWGRAKRLALARYAYVDLPALAKKDFGPRDP